MGIGCAARSYNFYTHYTVESGFNIKQRKALLDEYLNNDFRTMKYYGFHMNEIERKCRFAIYGAFIGKIDLNKYKKLFESNFENDFEEQYFALLELGLMEKKGDDLILTDEGRVYTDMICEAFWSDEIINCHNNNK